MDWKQKAKLQSVIAKLPDAVSYEAYYKLQRHFGTLGNFNPVSRLEAGAEIWRRLIGLGFDPRNKNFLEVGTGRAPFTPIAFWLLGAGRITTIDVNPYVKTELLTEGLAYMRAHRDDVETLFDGNVDSGRLATVLDPNLDPSTLLEVANINYISNGDAGSTDLDDGTVDVHMSFNVLEHIPAPTIVNILTEAKRLIGVDGIAIHRIDYSDHFAHDDDSISMVNFLQFDEREWDRLAGNRFMFMNRLRVDDMTELFRQAGLRVNEVADEPDNASLIALTDVDLDQRFSNKSPETLATLASWTVAQT